MTEVRLCKAGSTRLRLAAPKISRDVDVICAETSIINPSTTTVTPAN
jgi:hypothetical protein